MSEQSKRTAILIVDDEPLVRMDLAELVSECGFQPFQAGNTSEALAMLEAAPDTFAAVVTDIQMPGTRSGLVLANHVAHVWPDIRIIVMSAGRKPVAGELPHGTPFVAKPYSVPVISAAISGAAS
jgi:two-component system, response regulator PdtaR